MNMGYLPFFIKLYSHYKLSGEMEKAERLKRLTIDVAKKGDPNVNMNDWFSDK
jgi:hypothetical protein